MLSPLLEPELSSSDDDEIEIIKVSSKPVSPMPIIADNDEDEDDDSEEIEVTATTRAVPAVIPATAAAKANVFVTETPRSPRLSTNLLSDQLTSPYSELPSIAPKSPMKSPVLGDTLPPLLPSKINISKRKRLLPFSTVTAAIPDLHSDGIPSNPENMNPVLTPSKLRSFSSPVRPLPQFQQKRAPSLQDRPIPVLSPPPPSPGSTISESSEEVLTPKSQTTAGPSSSEERSVIAGPSKLSASYRSVTSPLASKVRGPLALKQTRVEMNLDRDILKWRRLLDQARQAEKYQAKKKDDEKLQEVTGKWREAAQKAANELFELATEKIDRLGGFEEFVQRQKEREEAVKKNNILDGELDYEALTEEEKERFDEMKEEYEEEIRQYEEPKEILPTEFTLEYMLKSLNVDYKLIFPAEGDDEGDDEEDEI
ncbi:hypothetical protein D0Z00_003328 [Geotrichum galactomycetum]|uniref:Uncharacterized protein n=1 Tax=Geotrichum galactomycetum TaxID=27317 RepID=A0ACB6V1V2_9ASCO|nr:hypothetical protein D0Z00_003328 [Geotrichum candidum]